MSDNSDEMDYDQAVGELSQMFPQFSKDVIIKELDAAGNLCPNHRPEFS